NLEKVMNGSFLNAISDLEAPHFFLCFMGNTWPYPICKAKVKSKGLELLIVKSKLPDIIFL
ncbi:Hypothetical Protein FCC1311_116602, partial [Hondaea fermentalgiana]